MQIRLTAINAENLNFKLFLFEYCNACNTITGIKLWVQSTFKRESVRRLYDWTRMRWERYVKAPTDFHQPELHGSRCSACLHSTVDKWKGNQLSACLHINTGRELFLRIVCTLRVASRPASSLPSPLEQESTCKIYLYTFRTRDWTATRRPVVDE